MDHNNNYVEALRKYRNSDSARIAFQNEAIKLMEDGKIEDAEIQFG